MYTEHPIDTVPLYGLSRMKEVISQGFLELVESGFTDSRVNHLKSVFGYILTWIQLCWYTDSSDNDVRITFHIIRNLTDLSQYVIDYVPNYSDSLFICTGDS